MTIKCYRYSVKPRSRGEYIKARPVDKCRAGEEPCAICGKPVKVDTHPFWGIITEGGDRWGLDDRDGQDNLGAFPVGNDCHRKYVVKEG